MEVSWGEMEEEEKNKFLEILTECLEIFRPNERLVVLRDSCLNSKSVILIEV